MKCWLGLVLVASSFAQEREAALYERIAEQIRKDAKPAAAEVQDYLTRLGARLAAGERWEVAGIVSDSGIFPFPTRVPGHVFVPTRVIALAHTEAELAGVIAHAIAHRVDRTAGIITVVGEGLKPAEEIRADRQAVARMAAAGYHPQALLDYIERVGRPTPERLAGLKAAIAATPAAAESIENTSEFVSAQAQVRVVEPKLPRRAPSLLRQ